ncbi:MAG TPA: SAF domain-containing protein [Mycobacterium sp.]|uniref:SAF domain-containing protein n=1 Tax=Mycobacterium sp. TaxID=1785 RepID=UPI002D5A36A2|nr:SAF domain-containing protein [Mycobacterium sp.]HZU47630.1 SAF domain-containing protein [Mycobacterium sp.]
MSVGLQRGSDTTRKEAAERSPLAIVPMQRARNLRLAALCLGVAAGFALLFVSLLLLNSGTDVLTAARPVALGHVFQASDFRTTRVKVSDGSMDSVSASAQDSVIGHAATVPLNSGEIVPKSAVGPAASIPTGYAVVAVSVKPGQFPSGLGPGERVWVVSTATAPTEQTAPPQQRSAGTAVGPSPVQATVLATEVVGDDPQASTVVSLLVGGDAAPQIATLAASGQVSLVLIGPDGSAP